MASSLRAKLNAMKSGAPAAAVRRPGGLVSYVHCAAMPKTLYSPASEALRRIGWNGRAFDVEQCLFLDTETTGLSGGAGTVAFLVGLGYIRNGQMTVEQFFMKDYSDEGDLLEQVRERMERFSCVVTFNGRAFDMPLLASRFVMNRMGSCPDLFNLDLLTPSRRAWKLRIESCRLSDIEERILSLRRDGDLPGSQVPERYFAFLKSGDMALVEDIIRHNRQDIISLGLLLDRLLQVYRSPEKQGCAQDLYSLGRALERQGESAPARELYRLSAVPRRAVSASGLRDKAVAGQANQRLYRLCLRAGDVNAAVDTLRQMIARRQMGILPHVELAKIYEHRLHNPRRALEHTRAAISACTGSEMPDLRRREARLTDKIKRENDRKEGSRHGNSEPSSE